MSQDTTSHRVPCDTGPRYLSPLNLTSPDLSLRVLGHAGLQGIHLGGMILTKKEAEWQMPVR